jgi:hypothetical protein
MRLTSPDSSVAMRRVSFVLGPVALTVVLAGVSASPTVATASHKLAPKCPRSLVRRITADRRAIVYEGHGPRENGEEGLLMILACAGGHRPYALGHRPEYSADGASGVKRETLTGIMVAFEEFSREPEGPSESRIVVRDLRTGQIIHRVPNAESDIATNVGSGAVTKIVLKGDGAVAWIVAATEDPKWYEVRAADDTGSRLLASGADITPNSLKLKGSALRWTQSGKPASAVLN